jgi:hypothetical protein
MAKQSWREHLPAAAQTPNLPCVSRAARFPAPELSQRQQPQRRLLALGLANASRFPPLVQRYDSCATDSALYSELLYPVDLLVVSVCAAGQWYHLELPPFDCPEGANRE